MTRVLTCVAAAAAAVLALALAGPAGCTGYNSGTTSIGLITAPGSMLLDRVVRLQLTLTNPRQRIVLDRTERGFDLSLDLEATGGAGALVVDGLDADGAVIATGRTPLFPLGAINVRIVVYMAPPMSIGAAPVALDPARSRPAAAALSYGAVLAGGIGAEGLPSDAIQIYNAYDHSLVEGRPMPSARAGTAVAVTATNSMYLFGGAGPDGATSTLWLFDNTHGPAGELWFFDSRQAIDGFYTEIAVVDGDGKPAPQYARTDCAAVPTDTDTYLITGAPTIQLAMGKLTKATAIAAISGGASVVGSDLAVTTILVEDATGELRRLRGGTLEPLGVQRKGGVAVALPDRRVAVIGGDAAPRDVLVIDPAVDPATDALTPVPGVLAEDYAALAVAVTPRFVVVAGSRAGLASTGIEVLDAATLERRYLAQIPDVITAAVALPNEQVLLIGTTLQLFTPPAPDL